MPQPRPRRSVSNVSANMPSGRGRFLFPAILLASSTLAVASAAAAAFSGLVDIGGGRKMYLTCRGTGSPTIILIAGLKASADDWNITQKPVPTVFAGLGDVTRVCAYDRPGTPVGEQPSRSDPIPQ